MTDRNLPTRTTVNSAEDRGHRVLVGGGRAKGRRTSRRAGSPWHSRHLQGHRRRLPPKWSKRVGGRRRAANTGREAIETGTRYQQHRRTRPAGGSGQKGVTASSTSIPSPLTADEKTTPEPRRAVGYGAGTELPRRPRTELGTANFAYYKGGGRRPTSPNWVRSGTVRRRQDPYLRPGR